MIKALVVDDDEIVTAFIQRLLTKKFAFEVVIASNGIEALQVLQKDSPQIIFLDVTMPLMDGIEFLEAIRADPKYSELPVIIMSSVNDRKIINQLIDIGITGYILKPLEYDATYERLNKIITKYRSKLRHDSVIDGESINSKDKKKLLLVDRDINFKTFFKELYKDNFEIIEGETGSDCLSLYLKNSPKIILLGENLSIVNEKLLAKKIRELDEEGKTEIFIFKENPGGTNEYLYDGVLKKSFVPENFSNEFSKIVLRIGSSNDQLLELVQTKIRDDATSAVKQAFGVLAHEEIIILGPEESENIHAGISCKVKLFEENEKMPLFIIITGSKESVKNIINKLNGNAENGGADDLEAFKKFSSSIADRIKESMEKRGLKILDQGIELIENGIDLRSENWKFQISVQTKTGEKFITGIQFDKNKQLSGKIVES